MGGFSKSTIVQAPMITLMIFLFIFICHIAYSYMHFLLTAFLFEDLVLLSVYYLP